MAMIVPNVTPEVSVVIDNMETAKEMWDHLNKLYIPHGFNLQYVLLTKLYAPRLDECTSVNDYTLRYKALLGEIAASGLRIEDPIPVILFLAGLGSSYGLWVSAKRSGARSTVPSLDSLIAELVDEERLNDGTEKLALFGKTKNKGKEKKKNTTGGSKDKRKDAGKGKGKDGLCSHCEKGVHSEGNYLNKHPNKIPEAIKKKREKNSRKKTSNLDRNDRSNDDNFSLTAVESVWTHHRRDVLDSQFWGYQPYVLRPCCLLGAGNARGRSYHTWSIEYDSSRRHWQRQTTFKTRGGRISPPKPKGRSVRSRNEI